MENLISFNIEISALSVGKTWGHMDLQGLVREINAVTEKYGFKPVGYSEFEDKEQDEINIFKTLKFKSKKHEEDKTINIDDVLNDLQ